MQAEEYDLTEGLVASYSFDKEDLTDSVGGADASAIVTGLGAYSGTLEYVEGQSGKGIQLGDYGLKLNRENLGENFTVSLWIKPDGNILADQSTLFLGWHSPEKWLAVAGEQSNSTLYRFWGNGNGFSWTGAGNPEYYPGRLASADPHREDSSTVKAYLDGEQWGTGDSNAPLVGDNQDIYVGVTYWDVEFTGAVDEVKVYDRTLSEGEVYRLYDPETPAEELLERDGITVTESMNMVLGRTQQIELSMNQIAADSNPEITFESADPKVAEVSEDGLVTAAGAGETQITVSVTLGDTTVKAITNVSVTGSLDETLVASYDFEGSLENGVEGGADASMLVTGLNSYVGQAAY